MAEQIVEKSATETAGKSAAETVEKPVPQTTEAVLTKNDIFDTAYKAALKANQETLAAKEDTNDGGYVDNQNYYDQYEPPGFTPDDKYLENLQRGVVKGAADIEKMNFKMDWSNLVQDKPFLKKYSEEANGLIEKITKNGQTITARKMAESLYGRDVLNNAPAVTNPDNLDMSISGIPASPVAKPKSLGEMTDEELLEGLGDLPLHKLPTV